MADAAIGWERSLGIDTSYILRREGRMGVYFLETGANQRSSTVVYDRAGSSVALAAPEEYDFDAALDQVFEQLDGQVALPDAALPIEELAPEDWVTDGNSVVLEKENAVMAETFTMYSALTTGLSKRLALLRYAASDGR